MKPQYFDLPDDGALFTCAECKHNFLEEHPEKFDELPSSVKGSHDSMWLIVTPDGKRQVLHKGCVDETWFNEYASYGGRA